MIAHALTHKDVGDGFGPDPTLVITVGGVDDVYRLARLLERGQSEFQELGQAILAGMAKGNPGIVHAMTASMGPHAVGQFEEPAPRKRR